MHKLIFFVLSLYCQYLKFNFDLLKIWLTQINKVTTVTILATQEIWLVESYSTDNYSFQYTKL